MSKNEKKKEENEGTGKEEQPKEAPEVKDLIPVLANVVVDEGIPLEIATQVMNQMKSMQKDELAAMATNNVFKVVQLKNALAKNMKLLGQLAKLAPNESEALTQLIKTTIPTEQKQQPVVQQPQQQQPPQREGLFTGEFGEIFRLMMLFRMMPGPSGGENTKESIADMIKAIKELMDINKPEQPKEQTVQMPIGPGGAMVDVPLSLAVVMMTSQSGLSKEDLEELLKRQQPQQQQMNPEELRQQIMQEIMEEKKMWEEILGTKNQGKSDEVLIKEIETEAEKERMRLEHERKLKEQELKLKEIESQKKLVEAILAPEPSEEKKKSLEDTGKLVVKHLFS